jgi:hypothetical protein
MEKRKMLVILDPNESLSYLESQLDFLTSMVINMYSVLSEDQKTQISQQTPKFNEFVTVIQENSVFTVKDVNKCVEEINTKKKVRELQAVYYQIEN